MLGLRLTLGSFSSQLLLVKTYVCPLTEGRNWLRADELSGLLCVHCYLRSFY